MNADVSLVTIVADDLTGAIDTAQGFAARGHETSVVAVLSVGSELQADTPESSIVGVNTDSRYNVAERAADRVAAVVRRIPGERVYKKIDSTLRGNVGSETNAALRASGADLALVAPAFPAAGRTTSYGIHYVNGTPVDQTEYAADTKGPSSATVTDYFEGYDRTVVHISADIIEAGHERVAARLADTVQQTDEPPVVVCDACDGSDLATIADAGDEYDTLYVGSGGLAEHVAVPESGADSTGSLSPPAGAPLGVVGSVSSTSIAQLERVPEEIVIELDPITLLTETAVKDAVEVVCDRLAYNEPAILTAATDKQTVAQTIEAGKRRGLNSEEIGSHIAAGLAETAAAVVTTEPPSGLFYTGGDVAIEGLSSLDATIVRLLGRSISTGIPVGRLVDGVSPGIPLITKAGGFGDEEAIINCLEALSGNDAR